MRISVESRCAQGRAASLRFEQRAVTLHGQATFASSELLQDHPLLAIGDSERALEQCAGLIANHTVFGSAKASRTSTGFHRGRYGNVSVAEFDLADCRQAELIAGLDAGNVAGAHRTTQGSVYVASMLCRVRRGALWVRAQRSKAPRKAEFRIFR